MINIADMLCDEPSGGVNVLELANRKMDYTLFR
jgi:hypothetical protein